jgi:hypothetical protein
MLPTLMMFRNQQFVLQGTHLQQLVKIPQVNNMDKFYCRIKYVVIFFYAGNSEEGFSADWLASQGTSRVVTGQIGNYQAQQPPPHPAFTDMEDEESKY